MRESLLADPGAITIIKYLRNNDESKLDEISEGTGIDSGRLESLIQALKDEELVLSEMGSYRLDTENLYSAKNDMRDRLESKDQDVKDQIRRKDEDLQALKEKAIEKEQKALFDEIEVIEDSMKTAEEIHERVEVLSRLDKVLEVESKNDPERTRTHLKALRNLETVLED